MDRLPTTARWGRCTWYKDHPDYVNKNEDKLPPDLASMMYAVWKTQHAGDQNFGMFSTQMFGAAVVGEPVRVLLHKTLLFRKVVLSPPAKRELAHAA